MQKAIAECHQGLSLYKDPMSKYKDGFYCNLGRFYFRLEQYDSCAYYVEKQLDFMNAMHYEIVPHIVDLGFFIGRALLLEVADALAAAVVLIVQLVHVIGVQYEV